MDWNSIKVFLAVANCGSLMGASRSLGISISTVHRRLNTLEDQVGLLFNRINGSYELTEIGTEFSIYAQRISNSVDDIERNIVGKDIQPRGNVRITAPTSFSYNCLPRYLKGFNREYPDISIELLVTNTDLNLTNRDADIAIRVTQSPPEHLVGRQICKIKWGVYAGLNYQSEFGLPAEVKDLKNHRLIGASGMLRSRAAFLWLDEKFAQNIELRSDDLTAISFMAANDQGLAFLPDDLRHPGLKRLFTFEPGGHNALWILTHPDLRKIERIKIVMEYLSKALSQDNGF